MCRGDEGSNHLSDEVGRHHGGSPNNSWGAALQTTTSLPPCFPAAAATALLAVSRAGGGGADELRTHLDDAKVQWALLSLQLGSGSFQRRRVVFLHFNGDSCGAVLRGRLNSRTFEVQQALREHWSEGFHATVEVKSREEVSVDALHQRVNNFFVKDDLGEHSKKWKMTQAARERTVKVAASTARPSTVLGTELGPKRRTFLAPGADSAEVFATGRDALRGVVGRGSWNWVLVGSDPDALPLVAGGSGGLDELRDLVERRRQDEVSFGLLRVAFGVGRLRREKFVFLHISGARVPLVKRGHLAVLWPRMEEAIRKLVDVSPIHFVDAALEDLTEDAVVERVRRACVVDDEEVGKDESSRPSHWLEAFREATRQERAAYPTLLGKKELCGESVRACDSSQQSWSVDEAVKLLHAGQGVDWVLFDLADNRSRNRAEVCAHTS